MEFTQTSTYQCAVIQARAHRALKAKLSYFLKGHNLTMMQWAIIGVLAEAGKTGMRVSDLASLLDTSLAFITTTVNVLEAKRMVKRTSHGDDNRAKIVTVTDSYKPKVIALEKTLHTQMDEWLKTVVSQKDMASYLRVAEEIAKTA